jgi:glycerate dehydrogenase
MNITILDGHALNPGDMDYSCFEKFGKLTVYPRSAPEVVIERAADSEIVFTNKITFDETVLVQLPKLKYIGIFATGYNVVDVEAARRRGITVTNIPKYSTDSVVQLTFAHLLNMTFRLSDHTESVQNGDWCRSIDFCYWNASLVELAGLTFGIVGYGTIGKKIAILAEAFGMNSIAYGPRLLSGDQDGAVRFVDFDELLKTSDVVSLHCPLKDDNHGMIGVDQLAKMKPTAFLLNLSRGALLDESAVAVALNSGRIAGAGLDVLSTEPPSPTNPLIGAKNCFITPHIAWGTLAARQRLLKIAVENLQAFLDGKPQNVV